MTDDAAESIGEPSIAEFEIKVSNDRLRVLFSCGPDALGRADLFDQVAERLRSLKIREKPNQALFEAAVAKARTGPSPGLTDLPLATGLAPEPPVDGSVDWTREYFDSHYPVDPLTGAIDFKHRVGDPAVAADDLLVKITLPSPGRAGLDVFGAAIPVRPPADRRLIPAQNVRWDEEAGGFRASCAGRVIYRDGQLRVDPVLRVRGDVGGATGNIRHNGSVQIEGDVDGGFTVEATGDVEIHGMIYEASVDCGGSLAIVGGVNGNDRATLVVAGDLHAKFLLNATVRSGGDVVAEKEIYRCRVSACGEVSVPGGRIVGGEIVATRGIVVGEAGSSSDASTVLALHPDPACLAELKRIKAEVGETLERLQPMRSALRDLQKQESRLGAGGKQKLADLAAEVRRILEWVAAQGERNKELLHRCVEDQRATVEVRHRLCSGVWIKIHHGDYRSNVEMLGPIVARLNRGKGTVELEAEDEEGIAPGVVRADAA